MSRDAQRRHRAPASPLALPPSGAAVGWPGASIPVTSRLRHALGRRAPAFVTRRLSARASSAAAHVLDHLAPGGGPLVAGPWVSEVGFELLYWLPLLTWLRDERGIDPARVVAVTRGGAGAWYGGVAGRVVELLDHVEPDELRRWQQERLQTVGSEKQGVSSAPERELIARVARELGAEGAAVLHPSVMYRLFHRDWVWGHDPAAVGRRLVFEPIPPAKRTLPDDLVPSSFVAVKAYHSACFPDTAANRRFLHTAVTRLAERTPVVLLRAPLPLEEHPEPLLEIENVVDAAPLLDPGRNLAQQTELVRRADALVTTYGGFSYLGPLVGVPTLAFYSDTTFNRFHLRVRDLAVSRLGLDAEDYPPPVTVSEAGSDGLLPLLPRLAR